MAGSIGIDPRKLTLRQLLWMAEGISRERWAHTSMICALIANANRDPRKCRPFKPDDFNPYTPRSRKASGGEVIEVNSETIGLLRRAFKGDA